jgi:hypothetical protein
MLIAAVQATLVAQRMENGVEAAGFGAGLGGAGLGPGLGAFESLAEDGTVGTPGTASLTAATGATYGASDADGAFGYRGGGGGCSFRGPAVVGVPLQPFTGRGAKHRRQQVFACR